MIIKEIKFSYVDRKYKTGPFIDFFGELEVPALEYDTIIKVIQQKRPECEDINVMSFKRTQFIPQIGKFLPIIYYSTYSQKKTCYLCIKEESKRLKGSRQNLIYNSYDCFFNWFCGRRRRAIHRLSFTLSDLGGNNGNVINRSNYEKKVYIICT